MNRQVRQMRDYRNMSIPRILVAEDNPDARELIVLVLARLGYEIIEARNGAEALDKATVEKPDLILLDLGLPMLGGDEVTAHLKTDPRTADVPIVINTAFDPKAAIVKRAIAAGADQVLYKPTDFVTLAQVVRRFLRRAQSHNHPRP